MMTLENIQKRLELMNLTKVSEGVDISYTKSKDIDKYLTNSYYGTIFFNKQRGFY